MTECPICWSCLNERDVTLSCGHKICRLCDSKLKSILNSSRTNNNLRNCPLCRAPIASYKEVLIPDTNEENLPWRRRTRATRRGPRLVRNRRRNIELNLTPIAPNRTAWSNARGINRSPPQRERREDTHRFNVVHSPANDRRKQTWRRRRSEGYFRNQRSRYDGR